MCNTSPSISRTCARRSISTRPLRRSCSLTNILLNAALRKVSNLEIIKREEDPLRWLANSLHVDPGNAEILRVSLTTTDGKEAAAILQAVLDEYKIRVVDKEVKLRQTRLGDLEKAYAERLAEKRGKWDELNRVADQVGSGDTGALSIKQQLALQQFNESRTELSHLRGELQRAQTSLKAKLAASKGTPAKSKASVDADAAVEADRAYAQLEQELAGVEQQISEVRSVAKGGIARAKIETLLQQRAAVEDQLAARRQKITERLEQAASRDGSSKDGELKELQANVALLADQVQEDEKDLEIQKQQVFLFGHSSIEVEMLRSDIQELNKVLAALADERQQLKVEFNSQTRIQFMQETVDIPVSPDKASRLQNAMVSGVCGFLAPVCLLLWWDVRARRINTVRDVSHGLGLTVVGTVPNLARSQLSRMLPDSRRHRQMQVCLNQSIDGIVAKLFLRHDARKARVVLVSSATRGEGKSTLSIQLAQRLAHTGAATLLVDFDLRKSSLHDVFNAPRSPGVSEFLRGETEFERIVRPTDSQHLSLLTAGAPFTNSLGTLSNGVTRSLFDQARKNFEFVVVDGSPILPVVDALLTSQHVDTVVLSMRRDVSEAPRIREACAQLSAFGVEECVAVLAGSDDGFNYYGDHEHGGTVLEAPSNP